LPESVNSAPFKVASEQLIVAVGLLIQDLGCQVFQQVAVLLHLHSKSFQRPFLRWQLTIHIGLQQIQTSISTISQEKIFLLIVEGRLSKGFPKENYENFACISHLTLVSF